MTYPVVHTASSVMSYKKILYFTYYICIAGWPHTANVPYRRRKKFPGMYTVQKAGSICIKNLKLKKYTVCGEIILPKKMERVF